MPNPILLCRTEHHLSCSITGRIMALIADKRACESGKVAQIYCQLLRFIDTCPEYAKIFINIRLWHITTGHFSSAQHDIS